MKFLSQILSSPKQLCAIALLGLACLLPKTSMAQNDPKTVVTWNMQGANAGTENKWRSSVAALMNGGTDVLLLQEAGQVPNSAQVTSRTFSLGIPLNEFMWNLGTRTRPRNLFIYFARVDQGANRVNLAIVSTQRADDVFAISPRNPSLRPTIGILLGNQAFFAIHGASPGGAETPELINSVSSFFLNNTNPALRNTEWFIGGDFNRAPANLQAATRSRFPNLNITLINTNLGTQQSGGELDYAVTNATASAQLNARPAFARRLGQIASDHVPVEFTVNSQ